MGTFFTNGPGRSGRRTIATFLLFLFAFVLASSTLLGGPRKANAQYTDPITSVQTTTTNVWTTIKDAFVEAAVTAVVNGVNYFTSQLAYTAAVALTSDCPGQVVCWNSKAFEDGFKQAWQGAIGEAIGTLSTQGGFTKLGFDLCNPSIKFSLKIQLGALDEIKPPPPKCDFNAIASNWSNFKDSVTSGEVLKGLKPTFERGQSPLSVALGAQNGLYEVKEEAKRADVMKRIMDASAGGGFSDVRDPVSGRAKAPSSVTHDEFQRMKKMQQDNPQQYSASYAAGQIASKAVISIVVNAVQTFAMTLISRLLNKLINGLMSTEELIALQPDLILNPEGLLNPPGATGATEALATRFTAAQPKDTGIIDPLLEFSVCPGNNRGPNNCVLDQQFANAIRVGDVTPVTVREAIEKNMLHGDWSFVGSTDPVKDQDPFCYTYAYCESNIKKLRAARILPIGWEIAARKAGPNTKLREIVAGFASCSDTGTIDAAHPWCHLIDPDWVLKIPPTQCRAMAFGSKPLSSEIPTRVEQCVDTQTCLKQDDTGTCVGGWGYCARERNIWRFNGDSCPAAYNTCRTLKSRTGEVKNFVLNTIDHGICNADNAGCRQYGLNLSTVSCSRASVCSPVAPATTCPCTVDLGSCTIVKDKTSCTAPNGVVCRQTYPCNTASCSCTTSLTCDVEKDQRSCSALTGGKPEGDDWQLDPARFLNKNAQTCSATSNGCSALVSLRGGEALNLVRNPSFEEVEDGDNDGTPDHAKYWTPFAEVAATNKGYLSKDGAKAVDGANAMLLPLNAAFNPPAGVGTTAACTLPVVTNSTISAGTCIADLGCPCTYATAGAVVNNTCKVIKGQQKCSVTENVTQSGLPVRKRVTYSVQATFIPDSGSAVHGGIGMSFKDATGAPVSLVAADVVATTGVVGADSLCVGGSNPGTVCTENASLCDGGTCTAAGTSCLATAGGELLFTVDATKNADSKGVTAGCTFVIDNKDVAHGTIWLFATTGNLYADAIQLEEGGGTSYHDKYGPADSTQVNIKVPPDFLGCTGDEGQRPECDAFAGVCRENEVGCDAYTPINGDPTIPGIAGPQDLCPEECSGYDVFKQEESDFDAEKFPVYFIPAAAKSCTENEVGCSEFTNVETEKVEYYSHLRLCMKPDDVTKGVYYSWEGSDTTGYQLLVWNLKNTTTAGNALPAPVANGSPADIAAGLASDVCADASCANAGEAPCTRLDASAVACASKRIGGTSDTTGYCNRQAIDNGDFDCREFYDAAGNRHYRQLSKTILASASCVQYRITVSSQIDCEKSNGRWDGTKGQCIYFADASQSKMCPKDQNSCRAYKGNASTNIRSLFRDDVETWPDNWVDSDDSTAPADGVSPLGQSAESVTVGGHSLKIGGTTGTDRLARREVGGLVGPGRSYTLNFWARGAGVLNVGFRDGSTNTSCSLDSACPVDATGGCACTTPTGLICMVAAGTTGPCNIYPATGKCSSNGAACASAAACPAGSTCTLPSATPAVPRGLNFSDDDEASSPRTTAPKIILSSEWKQYTLGPVIMEPGRCSNDATRACSTSRDCAGGAACTLDPGLTDWGRTSTKLNFQATGVCVGGTSNGISCTAGGGACAAGGGTCAMADVFIDNVELKEVQDSIFVVRDSWVTPASCDSTPDGIPSPQEMLGCKEYKTSGNERAFLRSFTSLCRERAVGCRAFSTLQNTPQNPYEESFNAVCRLREADGVTPRKCGFINCTQTQCHDGAGCSCTRPQGSCLIPNLGTSCDISVPADAGAACSCDYDMRSPTVAANAPQLMSDVCRVAIGDTDCRFKLDVWDDSTRPDEHPDRANIPADKRVYLVGSGSGQCSADQVGCRAMGLPHYGFEGECNLTPGFVVSGVVTNNVCNDPAGCVCGPINGGTCPVARGEKSCKVSFELGVVDKWQAVAIKDDPSKYEQTLCSSRTLNCESYTASDGTYYFRDPVDKVCEYKDNANVNGATVSGFFRRSSTGALFPCYPELLQAGDYYALYKNADEVCTLPNITTSGPFTPANPKITLGRCQDDGGCLCTVAPNPVPVCKVFKGNTTCGYQGWVGVCEAKYDRCEEFVDPVSTSASHPAGQPYYYIVNNKLDLKTCSGKASLKQGCVLFKQTSKTQNLYSSAATYLRSVVEAANGTVPPVNCDLDPRSPYCEERCFSIPEGVCSESPEKFCKQDTEDPDLGCPGPGNHCTGRKRYGNGCSSANGSKDCNQGIGEQCASVSHCSIKTSKFCDVDGDCTAGEGTCVSPPPPPAPLPALHILKGEATITKNDANVIVKVRPDRECAQWFTCTSYDTVYDEQQNKIKPVCSAFSLCDESRGQTANNFECAHTFDPPKKVLTDRDYAQRDVTFAGLEFSGFSIPGRYPAQYLSPFSIIKGRCVTAGGTATARGVCVDSLRCTTGGGAPTDYCKKYTGICEGDRLGQSCDLNTDCGIGYCSKSFFSTTRYAILLDSNYSCKDDTECDGNDKDGAACTTDDDCRSSTNRIAKCVRDNPTDATGQCSKTGQEEDGSCLEHKCFYSYGGSTLNPADAINAALCRAYPEEDSPYAESTVEREGSARGFDILTGQAVQKKAEFKGSNVCSFNNNCECTYQRFEYGKSGAFVRYYGIEGGQMIKPWTPDRNIETATVGVCSGGSKDGQTCRVINKNADCTTAPDDAGTCERLTKLSHVNGWPGFCMDPDKSILINGRPDQYNCNVWLPVDQLAGSPDNFNQFVEAGFTTDQTQLLYCAASEGDKQSTGGYDVVLRTEAGKPYPVTVCVTDHQCEGRSLATCTGLKNNTNAGFDQVHTENTDACVVVSGKCVDRVGTSAGTIWANQDNPPGNPDATMSGSDTGWNSSFNANYDRPYEFGACDRAAFYAADKICLPAVILGSIFAGPAGGAASAAACYSGITGWCDSLATCKADPFASSDNGPFFDTSWQDATVHNHTDVAAKNLYQNQLVAIRMEFPNEVDGAVHGRMYLYPGHWKATFLFDDNSSLGSAAGPDRNQAVGGKAIGDYPGDNPCTNLDTTEDECEAIEDNDMNNCIGAEAVFDGSGKFVNLKTVLCHNESTFSHSVSANAYAMIRESCTDIVQTHNAQSVVQNIAFTDSMWKAQNGDSTAVGLPAAFEYSHHTLRPRANPADLKPFGPVAGPVGKVNFNGVDTLDVRWPIPVFKSEGGSPFTNIRREGPQLWSRCGYPAETGVNAPFDPPMPDGNDCWSHVGSDPHIPNATENPDPGSYNAATAATVAGYPYACTGTCDMAGVSNTTIDAGYNLLSKMFVKSFGRWTYDDATNKTLTAPVYRINGDGYDKRVLYMSTATAPKVMGVNTGDCSASSDGLCKEGGTEAVTVVLPSCGGCTEYQGRVTAELKYFAFADKNHMPIRRRIVDFGDKTSEISTVGFYKNHHGCPATGTDNAPAGCGPEDQLCNSTIAGNPTPFGYTPQSCESRYFSDKHTYTCNPQILATSMPACGPPDNIYPCRDGDVCVYKPRVQVLDNWGVCNGSCNGGSGEANGVCFNGRGIGNANDPINLDGTDVDLGFPRNECWNLKDDRYTIKDGVETIKPWTEGDREIRVRS